MPVVRRVLSKSLIENGTLLRDEEPIAKDSYDIFMDDKELPLLPIKMDVDEFDIVDYDTLQADMERHPGAFNEGRGGSRK